jgi:integrase/recombinase XerD
MTPLRQHMITALQLRGTGERTPHASVREVRLLAQSYGTAPALLSAQELQHACLHRHNVAGLAPASRRLCSSGLRCFSPPVLQRDGPTRSRMRAHTAHRLPAVLRVEEVRRLLTAATPWHHQVSCTPVSRWGRRLHDALSLQGSARDGPRLQVQGHRGQGAKDRYVPRPAETRAAPHLLANPPAHDLALARHRARATAQPSGPLPAASDQWPGRLP